MLVEVLVQFGNRGGSVTSNTPWVSSVGRSGIGAGHIWVSNIGVGDVRVGCIWVSNIWGGSVGGSSIGGDSIWGCCVRRESGISIEKSLAGVGLLEAISISRVEGVGVDVGCATLVNLRGVIGLNAVVEPCGSVVGGNVVRVGLDTIQGRDLGLGFGCHKAGNHGKNNKLWQKHQKIFFLRPRLLKTKSRLVETHHIFNEV